MCVCFVLKVSNIMLIKLDWRRESWKEILKWKKIRMKKEELKDEQKERAKVR